MQRYDIAQTLASFALSTVTGQCSSVEQSEDEACVESFHLGALQAAETTYGAHHGEVGLALVKLAEFYRAYGKQEQAATVETRIADILLTYQIDQLF